VSSASVTHPSIRSLEERACGSTVPALSRQAFRIGAGPCGPHSAESSGCSVLARRGAVGERHTDWPGMDFAFLQVCDPGTIERVEGG